jgi:hypothetical protein
MEIAVACFSIERVFAIGVIGLTKCNTESFIFVNNFSYYTMSAKIKMGRPRLPKGQQKKVFPIRFTAEQLAAFESAAKKKRLPLRDWIDSTLTEAAGNIS